MVKVRIKYKDDFVTNVSISGHALMGDFGNDIVCSAISSICFCIGNQLLLIDKDLNISAKDNCFNFQNLPNEHDIQLLITTLINGLEMISQDYPQAIKLMEV